MVCLRRFERPTFTFGVCYSILLSYRHMFLSTVIIIAQISGNSKHYYSRT